MALPTAALVLEHLDLVPRLARKLRLTPKSFLWEDAIQAGSVGLVEAATRFDPARGVQFREYAWKFVQGAIADVLNTDSIVRQPRDHLKPLPAVEFHEKHGATETDAEEDAADDLDARRRRHDLRVATGELPVEQAEAALAYFDDTAVATLAGIKGISVRLAHEHLEFAKRALTEWLRDDDFDGDH